MPIVVFMLYYNWSRILRSKDKAEFIDLLKYECLSYFVITAELRCLVSTAQI